ncbi:MAG: thymidine kinase [Mycoplasmatales bacterium]
MKKTTIYFKYGCMNSGKSLELMKVAYNYEETGINPLVIKPKLDTRKKGEITSRVGLSKIAWELGEDNIAEIKNQINHNTEVILVDESQFLSPEAIEELVKYSYECEVSSLMFFGLKSDFRGELFAGSKRIIELADKIEESTSICWCGRKARQNARVVNGEIVKEGPTILVDDDINQVEYITLCNYHYFKAQVKGE